MKKKKRLIILSEKCICIQYIRTCYYIQYTKTVMIYYTLITFDTLEYSISDPYAQVLVEQEILPFTEVIV